MRDSRTDRRLCPPLGLGSVENGISCTSARQPDADITEESDGNPARIGTTLHSHPAVSSRLYSDVFLESRIGEGFVPNPSEEVLCCHLCHLVPCLDASTGDVRCRQYLLGAEF